MSLQATIVKLLLKLPAGLKIKMSGGEPVVLGGRTLDPNFQFIAHGAAKQPALSSLEPEVAQAASAQGLAMFAGKPERGVTWSDFNIPSRASHAIPVRLYKPDDQDPNAPIMAYWHMGGGVIGDLETCHTFCQMLSVEAKCPVVSVDYRLAPQHKFPAGLEDCIDAYEWALKNAEKNGAPAGRAAIGGDSMGGNFTAIIAQEMMRDDKPLPELQLLIYPATDMVTDFPSGTTYGETYPLSKDTMDWFMVQYLPEGGDLADVRLSPGLEPRLEGLPLAIIVTAGFDPLCDDGAAYAKKLEAEGVDVTFKCYDSLAHGFTAFTAVSPAARAACEEIIGMVRAAYAKL